MTLIDSRSIHYSAIVTIALLQCVLTLSSESRTYSS